MSKQGNVPQWVCGPNTLWMFTTNWPPGFRPQPIYGKRSQIEINEAAARGRAKRLASGDTGTINRLSRKGGVGRSDVSKGVVR